MIMVAVRKYNKDTGKVSTVAEHIPDEFRTAAEEMAEGLQKVCHCSDEVFYATDEENSTKE